jgi:hypothetical protein
MSGIYIYKLCASFGFTTSYTIIIKDSIMETNEVAPKMHDENHKSNLHWEYLMQRRKKMEQKKDFKNKKKLQSYNFV